MDNHLYIIIPFYNAVVTIERTLLSLSVISRPNRDAVTVIGIDDGSTDDSASAFERVVNNIDGIRHTLIRKKNGAAVRHGTPGSKRSPRDGPSFSTQMTSYSSIPCRS